MYFALLTQGLVNSSCAITAERLSYFLNINNALTFGIENYDDYNKDIFFALHDVARAMQEVRSGIIATVKDLATNQENAVMSSLAEGFELDEEGIRSICSYLLYNPLNLVEAIVAPVLAVAGEDNSLRVLPGQHYFNRLLQWKSRFRIRIWSRNSPKI